MKVEGIEVAEEYDDVGVVVAADLLLGDADYPPPSSPPTSLAAIVSSYSFPFSDISSSQSLRAFKMAFATLLTSHLLLVHRIRIKLPILFTPTGERG
jgi:hypothetical protein